MRNVQRNILLKAAAVCAASGLLLVFFQNCGKAGFEEAIGESMTPVEEKHANAPFAYDASYDQISYNSCFGSKATNPNAFYNLRAGAYDGGGVTLRPEFVTYVKSVLKPEYPATELTIGQMKAFVAETPENAEAIPQMAIRSRGVPNELLPFSGVTPGRDFVNIAGDLTDDRIMDPIFRSGAGGAAVNYFPLAVLQNNRIFEASMIFNDDQGAAEHFRKTVSAGMLSLTFTAFRSDAFAARAPAGTTSPNVAYGRGYNLTFEVPASTHTNNYLHTAILSQIQEYSLLNPSVSTGTWSCPEGRRYIIVAKPHQASVCPVETYDSLGDANLRRELEIVHRHLRPEFWDVNVSRRCVVPKTGSCYPLEPNGTVAVEYNPAVECYDEVNNRNPSAINRCAQYVSFCNRN